MSQASFHACKVLASQPQAIATKGLSGETFGLRSKRSLVQFQPGVPESAAYEATDPLPKEAKPPFPLAERLQGVR